MRKYYSILDTGGGGNDPNKLPPPQPEGYRALTVDERAQWNGFLDYLDKQKLGGSATLDQRDQSLGLKAMAAYKKANPNFTITPDRVPSIQYEQYQIRKGDSFYGLAPEQVKYVRNGLSPAYMNLPVSPVDGWLGSLTSKLRYPQAHRGTNTDGSYEFGTDVESYVKSLTDPTLEEKYKVKSQ
jgi:hypothetical protein